MTVDPRERASEPPPSRRGLAIGCLVLALLGMLGVGLAAVLLVSMLERDVAELEAETAERGRALTLEQLEVTRASLEALHPFSPPRSGMVSEVGHRRVLGALRDAVTVLPPEGSGALAERVALAEALSRRGLSLEAFVWGVETLRAALSSEGEGVAAHENRGIARRHEALLLAPSSARLLETARAWQRSAEAAAP